MKNILVPKEINKEKLKNFMAEIIEKIKTQEEKMGNKIDFCGSETDWFDCFNGFQKPDGTLLLCFQYNIGNNTKGFIGEFNPN